MNRGRRRRLRGRPPRLRGGRPSAAPRRDVMAAGFVVVAAVLLLVKYDSPLPSRSTVPPTLFADAQSVGGANPLPDMSPEEAVEHLKKLWDEASKLPPGSRQKVDALRHIYRLQPANLMVAVNFGLETSETPEGIQVLESCYDPSKVAKTLPEHDPDMAWRLANYIGRYRQHQKDYDKPLKFFRIAMELSKKARYPGEGDVCTALQLSTLMVVYPKSVKEADKSVARMVDYAESFLRDRQHKTMDDAAASNLIPKADRDPYDHCLLTLFGLSFFYRADVARVAALHYNVTAAAWPDFVHVAPHVKAYDDAVKAKGSKPECVDRKLRLGVFGGTLSKAHPVTEDFSGVLSRLDRTKFNVTYVYLKEQSDAIPAEFMYENKDDGVFFITRDDRIDLRNSTWIRRFSPILSKYEFDIILYLDLTMSTHARRLGMQRLAPVQLNTHGHPITSGHPRTTIQYFVSWAEAELAPEQSQSHYTEQLVLIPNGTIHQYYTRRVLDGGKSRLDGQPYKHLTRKDFGLPDDVRLYLNMQKPFKLHPEYDELVCGILKKDRVGHMILHHSEEGHRVFENRLKKAGCDLERIHFVPIQLHHRLLALYELSTVVLDSYPAGGCTTTREVLELGKAVVTLPARLLGGRWSLGLYNIIGLDEEAKKAVIASTPEEFIDLAVELCTNEKLRSKVEASIAKAVPNLFGRTESIRAWEKILLDVSPYDICPEDRPTSNEEGDEEEVKDEL